MQCALPPLPSSFFHFILYNLLSYTNHTKKLFSIYLTSYPKTTATTHLRVRQPQSGGVKVRESSPPPPSRPLAHQYSPLTSTHSDLAWLVLVLPCWRTIGYGQLLLTTLSYSHTLHPYPCVCIPFFFYVLAVPPPCLLPTVIHSYHPPHLTPPLSSHSFTHHLLTLSTHPITHLHPPATHSVTHLLLQLKVDEGVIVVPANGQVSGGQVGVGGRVMLRHPAHATSALVLVCTEGEEDGTSFCYKGFHRHCKCVGLCCITDCSTFPFFFPGEIYRCPSKLYTDSYKFHTHSSILFIHHRLVLYLCTFQVYIVLQCNTFTNKAKHQTSLLSYVPHLSLKYDLSSSPKPRKDKDFPAVSSLSV